MQLFFTTDIRGNLAYFDDTESRHLTQVLRRKEGDKVQFTDGQGQLFLGEIIEVGKRNCVVAIKETTTNFEARPFRLHIAIAPTKNMDRFEWFLEKATEIGIDTVTPITCFNSERRQLRNDRLEKIILAAAKQSLKFWLPVLKELTPFQTFIETQKNYIGHKFIAHCHPETGEHKTKTNGLASKKTVRQRYKTGENALILIGPEGDFSKEEVLIAQRAGFEPISLGQSRLRTETAALVAVSLITFLNDMEE